MEKWVLAVGYDTEKCNDTQREWLKYDVFIDISADMSEAVLKLSKCNEYLLVAIFSDNVDYLDTLAFLRSLTKSPILIMKHQYDDTEKIAAIDAGADEYIQRPETISEAVASGRSLIRRYTELNQQDADNLTILTYNDIFLCTEYRKAFVCGKEVDFTRQEFDFVRLLIACIGRAFTYSQICESIWGIEYEQNTNALWSLVSRLRRKIVALGGSDKIIQTVREVGYRIE